MRPSNDALRRTLPVVIFVGIMLCAVLITYLVLRKPPAAPIAAEALTATPKAVQGVRKTTNAGLPVRIKIPKINVDAKLDYIGLTPQGDLSAPKDPTSAGWYEQGPRPGDSGNAIIDGHFGYKSNRPAAFDDLYTLKIGEKVYVEDDNGTTILFLVSELREYEPGADTSDIFRPKDGKAHLKLITCKGSWDKTQKTYSARLVLSADKAVE